MSRGGIGKSRKKPPPPPPRRAPRARSRRGRVEARPRPALAAGLGGVMIGLSTFLVFLGIALLVSDEYDGGQTPLFLGFVTLPLGFTTVAVLSQKMPILRSALLGYLAAVATTMLLLLATGVLGFWAFFTSVTIGVGVGGLLTLRLPEGSSNRARLSAVGIVAALVLAAEAVGAIVVALIGPFLVVSVLHLADGRAQLKAASGS